MADPQHQDAGEREQHPGIPELEIDETIAPRPEEEAADIARSTPAPRVPHPLDLARRDEVP
jgi:hypothetical protein